nr:SDR family oxidoreductase [Allomuricauda sp.]
MIDKIGIIGCGWLGFPLAKHLVGLNYEVHGSTTSTNKIIELESAGIKAYQVVLRPDAIIGNIEALLADIDTLVINVPPRLRRGNSESFTEKMFLLHAEIKKRNVQKIVFVSSTSVYGDVEGVVSESTKPNPITESGKQLLTSESLFLEDANLRTAIIRFGGLIGPNRHPVTMLSKKTNLPNGNDPVNLIHLNDCIHMIQTVIENNYWGEIFNGVYPFHPSKKEYYTQEAHIRGLKPPDYLPDNPNRAGKIVKSQNFLDKSHRFHTSIVS